MGETEQLVGFVVDDVRSRLSGLFPPNSPSIFPPSTSPLHVLEIGCGSGAISLSLLHEIQTSFGKNDDGENGKTWEMTAIDVSVAAIDLTSKNAKKLKLDSDLRLRRASIHDIREGKCRGVDGRFRVDDDAGIALSIFIIHSEFVSRPSIMFSRYVYF